MVNPQALIFEKRAFAVIPPRKLFLVTVYLPENVCKTPLLDVMNRGSLGFCKMQLAFPKRRIPNIALGGRDVKIAAQ